MSNFNSGGPYFQARYGLARGIEAETIRTVFGHQGVDAYISLLCELLEAGGEIDMSDEKVRDVVIRRCWFDDPIGFSEFISLLVTLAIVEADYDESTGWVSGVSCPWMSEQLDRFYGANEQRRAAGIKSGEARRKKKGANE